MTPQDCTPAILALMHDEAFVALRRAAKKDALPYKQFKSLPMPEGFSVDETWAILTVMRRQTAVVVPGGSYHVREVPVWYTTTAKMADQLAEITARCRVGSPLDRAIAERASGYLLVRPLVEELLTAAWRDGLSAHYDDVRDVVLGNRPPTNPTEQLLLNAHNLLYEVERYAKRAITVGLIEEIYERIIEGVEPIEASPPVRNLEFVDTPLADPGTTLQVITDLGRRDGPGPFMPPVFIAVTAAHFFWDMRPLPAWNALVEMQIRRIYFTKVQLPVAVFLPVSTIWRKWEDGTVHAPEIAFRFGEVDPDCGEGLDYTTGNSIFLSLFVNELDALEQLVTDSKARDEHVKAMISHDAHINHRQRALLDEAIRRPDVEYRIEAHRRMHGVAYATARQDLLGLVDAGFLRSEVRGKAFVFRPTLNLKQLIEGQSTA